jgi:hypothetical protein
MFPYGTRGRLAFFLALLCGGRPLGPASGRPLGPPIVLGLLSGALLLLAAGVPPGPLSVAQANFSTISANQILTCDARQNPARIFAREDLVGH